MSEKQDQDPVSFEAALKELEGIVKQLETGEAKLEESLQLFERGIRLSRFCSQKLEEAEKKIEMLVKDSRGEYTAVPFEPEDR
ncbi:exodeoxyribonuclease VII small subunit [bacterium]|jgi:exodeoxyribonuclease VII small subunit|nr:exodeoxyribonuclease VII small subunit [bacterium]MCI0613540.1 exodeoxyribonuclease VII small subunit [bacterium]